MANGVIIPNIKSVEWTQVNSSLRYCVRNDIVFVWVATPILSGAHDTSIGTLPTEFMPPQPIYDCLFNRPSTGFSASIYIPTSGDIIAVTNDTTDFIYGMISYPKKQ